MAQMADSAKVIPLPVGQRGHPAASAERASAPADKTTPAPAVVQAGDEQKKLETQLVERARRGDTQAFRTLVERYQKRVFSLALGFLKNPDEARDVSQEAFLKVFQHLATFQGSASFYTWLYRITVNLCIDRKRKTSRHGTVEFDEKFVHEEVGSPVDKLSPNRIGFDPGRALHNRERRDRLNLALQELSEQHRAVLLLREIDGLSYKEIADVLECPEGTVMSRLFHARRQMQDLLRDFADNNKREAAPVAGTPHGVSR